MLTYNWNFNPITCQPYVDGYENVVITVHWQFYAYSGSMDESGSFLPQYTAQAIGTAGFTLDPSGSNFIPFNELTKETVLGWVTGSIGEDYIANMSASLEQSIIDQITPPTINLSPPWAT